MLVLRLGFEIKTTLLKVFKNIYGLYCLLSTYIHVNVLVSYDSLHTFYSRRFECHLFNVIRKFPISFKATSTQYVTWSNLLLSFTTRVAATSEMRYAPYCRAHYNTPLIALKSYRIPQPQFSRASHSIIIQMCKNLAPRSVYIHTYIYVWLRQWKECYFGIWTSSMPNPSGACTASVRKKLLRQSH
jgi:hypothetical protein